MRAIDLTGERFGVLRVISRSGKTSSGNLVWLCRCSCGQEIRVAGGNLRRKTRPTRSCGCEHKTQKGQSSLPEFSVWSSMIDRCHEEGSISYKNYGALGIAVCERWRASFDAFLEDVGVRPPGRNGKRAKYTLDRIDTSKGYMPGNVRWATWREQQNNRRNNRRVTFNGETHSLAEWGRRTSLGRALVRYRLERGWSVEDALTKTPHMGAPPQSKKRAEE